jgi:hypothetical protein
MRKEARDKAPYRSISAAAVTPAPAPEPAAAPAPAPVQRTIQGIGFLPTAPAAPSTDNGQAFCHLLSNASATTRSADQAQQVPATPTAGDIFVHEGIIYR